MNKLGILIVDDSPMVCELIAAIIEDAEDLYVSGIAGNGREACDLVAECRPNLITMDIFMPVMDGLEAIEEIMSSNPTPILVLTSSKDASIAYKAIMKGAIEVSEKPSIDALSRERFLKKVRTIASLKVIRHIRVGKQVNIPGLTQNPVKRTDTKPITIAIASSTGGPKALVEILSKLPENLPAAVLIAQHIGNGFTNGLIKWLNDMTKLKVQQAVNYQALLPGNVYIAPESHHIGVTAKGTITISQSLKTDLYTPSADHLLKSAAVAGRRSIGIVLSGMGSDGAIGISEMKKQGAATIAQDEESSVIYGMPKVAVESGCIDYELPLSAIAARIISIVNRMNREQV